MVEKIADQISDSDYEVVNDQNPITILDLQQARQSTVIVLVLVSDQVLIIIELKRQTAKFQFTSRTLRRLTR